MPKLYVNKFCVRCGVKQRICIPTFVCSECPVFYENVKDKSFYYDYNSGEKIKTK